MVSFSLQTQSDVSPYETSPRDGEVCHPTSSIGSLEKSISSVSGEQTLRRPSRGS